MVENNYTRGKWDWLIVSAFAVLSICSASFLIGPLMITGGKTQLGGVIGLIGFLSDIVGAVLMLATAFLVLPSLRRSAADYFTLLKLPAVLIGTNSIVGLLLSYFAAGMWAAVAFNLIRVAVVAYAGWLLVKRGRFSVWKAALAGLLLLFFDHPVIGGTAFLAQGQWMAFGGVLVSFVMFSSIAMLVGLLGGAVARIGSGGYLIVRRLG